jgi:hypothetical protein
MEAQAILADSELRFYLSVVLLAVGLVRQFDVA